jgi:hypothetical protein
MFCLMLLSLAYDTALPPADPRIKTIEYLIEGDRIGYNQDGTRTNEAKVEWSGLVKFHRDGAVYFESQTDYQPGHKLKASGRQGFDTRYQDQFRGRIEQTRNIGSLCSVFLDVDRRGIIDIWPSLFADCTISLKQADGIKTTRLDKLNGVDLDLTEIVYKRNTGTTLRYWLTKDEHPNVVRWEERSGIGNSSNLRWSCDITLRTISSNGETFVIPVEAKRKVFLKFNYKKMENEHLKNPIAIWSTRITPKYVKMNPGFTPESLALVFDKKFPVDDFEKIPNPSNGPEIRFVHQLQPSDPKDVANALVQPEQSSNPWRWVGIISGIVAVGGIIAHRRLS